MDERLVLLEDMDNHPLYLGKAGEGKHLALRFMTDGWKKEYPNAQVALHVTPPKGDSYLARLDPVGDGSVMWVVTQGDTVNPGMGLLELVLSDAETDTTIKSVTTEFIVKDSPSQCEPGDPPKAYEPWFVRALELIQTGMNPKITVTEIEGGHQLDITDANGTESFIIMDGVDGQRGASILALTNTVVAKVNSSSGTYYAVNKNDAMNEADVKEILIGDFIFKASNLYRVYEISNPNIFCHLVENLRGADGRNGVDGRDGADGLSVTITNITESDKDGGYNIVEFNRGEPLMVKNGRTGAAGRDGKDGYTPVKGVDYFDGKDGAPGSAGRDGTSVTITNVTESNTDGGSNVITFSDGKTLVVKNGKTGATGADGKDGHTPIKGVDYFDGADGKDGYTPVKGVDYFDGEKGDAGSDGKDGAPGADGFSPTVTLTRESDGVTIKATNKSSTSTAKVYDGKDGTGGGSGMPAGSEPYQQLVTDVDGTAKWGERTHYDELHAVLPRAEGVWFEDGSMFVFTTPLERDIIPGKTYILNCNGVDYECPAFEMPINEENGELAPVVGNPVAFGGDDNGAPILLIAVPPEPLEGVGEVTMLGMPIPMYMTELTAVVSITGRELVKLDHKYIDLSDYYTKGESDANLEKRMSAAYNPTWESEGGSFPLGDRPFIFALDKVTYKVVHIDLDVATPSEDFEVEIRIHTHHGSTSYMPQVGSFTVKVDDVTNSIGVDLENKHGLLYAQYYRKYGHFVGYDKLKRLGTPIVMSKETTYSLTFAAIDGHTFPAGTAIRIYYA